MSAGREPAYAQPACAGRAPAGAPARALASAGPAPYGARAGRPVRLSINGNTYELSLPANKLLLDVLREDLGLIGSKRGCDDSSCGACTVLVNGEPQMSCLMLAVSYQEEEITTIEGVARGQELDPLQRGFAEEGGAQCGYCTPGMILTARWLLARNPNPSEAEINEALSGNLCRCTGYTQILASVRRAVALLGKSNGESVG